MRTVLATLDRAIAVRLCRVLRPRKNTDMIGVGTIAERVVPRSQIGIMGNGRDKARSAARTSVVSRIRPPTKVPV